MLSNDEVAILVEVDKSYTCEFNASLDRKARSFSDTFSVPPKSNGVVYSQKPGNCVFCRLDIMKYDCK